MNLSSLVFFYTLALFVALSIYLFYLYCSSLRWDESEIRLLERLEVHLAHILRLVDAPDVKVLLENTNSRRRLFLNFSSYLREDVVELLRTRRPGGASLFVAGIFFLSYYLMRVKARFSCGQNDLRFLSGLELVLYRKVEGIEAG